MLKEVRLEALVDNFIHPTILRGPAEELRRARFAVGLSWLSALLFVVAAAVQGPVNVRALLILNLSSALLCVGAPFLLRAYGHAALICHAVLALSFGRYVAIALLLRGGGLSGATVLLSQLPLVATFLVGWRTGAVWALVAFAAGIGIGVAGRMGWIVDHLPASNRLVNDHFVLAVSTALLFAVAALYERTKDAAQRHIYALEARRQAADIERMQALSKAQLAEAEQLASLGRVAAAIAHEINNPLATVVANLELLAESPQGDASSLLQDGLAAAERIGRIVADMALCSPSPSGALGPVRVADAVELALKAARPRLPAHVRLELRLESALPPVVADTARLAQVLSSLLVNAAQAIPEGAPAASEIVVAARATDGRVLLEVRDTGRGIPAELVARVREPFFTTMAIGQGAGLGLALCEGTMRAFGGSMTIESQPGHTVVGLLLVVAAPAAERAPRTPRRPSAAGAKLAILIIDDDADVARTLKRLMRQHVVTMASGGRQALELLAGQARFDLIFCDLMMPDLSGIDVFEQLQATAPQVAERIIFITAGTFTDRAQTFRASVPNLFLTKPFDVREIRGIVEELAAAHQ